MKRIKKFISALLIFLLSVSFLPQSALANGTELDYPQHLSPEDGAFVTTQYFDINNIDWEDIEVGENDTVEYLYQSSLSAETNESDGEFVSPVYTSSNWFTESQISAINTPEGTYYWHVRARTGSGKLSNWSQPWKFNVDNTKPELSEVSILSNNSKTKWAKPGDTVTVKFTASEVLDSKKLKVTINDIEATSYTKNSASRVMTSDDAEGAITFKIEYTDLAGNAGTAVVATTDSSLVTFDKTSPVVKTLDEYKEGLRNVDLKSENYLADEGVYISEENKGEYVTVTTKWSIKEKNASGITYNVIFNAYDIAGNKGSKEVVVNLTDIKGETPESYLKTELIGGDAESEKGNDYLDKGIKFTWESDFVHVKTFGDLNLTKTGNYILGYVANEVSESKVGSKVRQVIPATRNITVVDTTSVSPVTNFVAKAYNGYVALSWTNPTEEDFAGVIIYRSTVKGEIGSPITTLLSKETSYFEDYNVVNGVTYYYTAVAYDDSVIGGNPIKSVQLVATPIAPKLVTTENTTYNYTYSEPEDKEVKSNTEEPKEDDNKEDDNPENNQKTNVPIVGIIILVLLVILGLYLLYLQNPEMLGKLALWKRWRKKK